jgi:hypothetical protein
MAKLMRLRITLRIKYGLFTEKRNEEPNMRQCVQVANLTDNTKESIDPILQGIATYSFKFEE